MNDNDFDLEKKRTDAGLSQEEMASFLSISQSQVSRYEKDPESVPYGVVVKWNQYCGEIGKLTGLKINDPRVEISSRLSLINDYSNASSINIDAKEVGFSIKDFIKNIKLTSRKPRLGVFGQFDSGKSTLINTILGGNSLPTGYQPATSVVSFIRHISEKPKWQAEDVWIMRKGFDFDKCDEEKHCIEYKMFAGGYDSLRQFGTHSGEGSKHKAFAAVVYLDSPLLLASDVVDLPGYGHSDDDQDRAEMAHKMVDIMIYASATTGFLGNQDLLYLSGLLKTLPTESYGQQPLGNLFIIGTHAHQVKSIKDRNDIKEKASKRAFKHLINTLKNHDDNIKEDDFLKRFYFFSVDDKSIRKDFESDLVNLLIQRVPYNTLKRLQTCINEGKESAKSICSQWIKRLDLIINEREKSQKDYNDLISGEEERNRKNEKAKREIKNKISLYSKETISYTDKVFNEKTSVSSIEEMIKSRYDDKKEAQGLAGTYLVESIQSQINDFVKLKSDDLGSDIDDMLSNFGPTIDKNSNLSDGFSFNPKIAFLSALSGIGTIGALAAWASIAAAGSNLGAYVLVAQVVGWLSSIGVSVGGAGTVMSFVSAIGGPITLGIAAGVLIALAAYSIFGDSWQLKLAKKINDNLTKESVREKMKSGINNMWLSTSSAFDEAIKSTEEEYQKYLKSLEKMAFSTNSEEVEKELVTAKETRDFFVGIPWKMVS